MIAGIGYVPFPCLIRVMARRVIPAPRVFEGFNLRGSTGPILFREQHSVISIAVEWLFRASANRCCGASAPPLCIRARMCIILWRKWRAMGYNGWCQCSPWGPRATQEGRAQEPTRPVPGRRAKSRHAAEQQVSDTVRKERVRIEGDGTGGTMCGPADNVGDLAAPGH